MANVMIPIDPDKKDDLYYRYKMPAVQCKVESSGNGVKTVIPNIHEICSAINRPEEVLMKHFQFDLGAQTTVNAKDDKYLVMGRRTEEQMQASVYGFVKKFVLCGQCQNPETAVVLDMKKQHSVSMVCGACGKTSTMDIHARAYPVMCQYYKKHPDEAKSGKGMAEARRKEAAAAPAAAAASAPAPVEKTKKTEVAASDLTDNRKDPVEVFLAHMKNAETPVAEKEGNGANFHVAPAAVDQLIACVVRLLSEYNMFEEFGVRLILKGIFTLHRAQPFAAIKAYAPLLRRFATVTELFYQQETYDEKALSRLLQREAKIQLTLLNDCAATLAQAKGATVPAAERMAVLAFLLFIEGIVKDISILAFATSEKDVYGVDPAVCAEMKTNMKAIVEWLHVDKEEEGAPAEEEAPATA